MHYLCQFPNHSIQNRIVAKSIPLWNPRNIWKDCIRNWNPIRLPIWDNWICETTLFWFSLKQSAIMGLAYYNSFILFHFEQNKILNLQSFLHTRSIKLFLQEHIHTTYFIHTFVSNDWFLVSISSSQNVLWAEKKCLHEWMAGISSGWTNMGPKFPFVADFPTCH